MRIIIELWWAMHNMVAHPLLTLGLNARWANRFHSWTAGKAEVAEKAVVGVSKDPGVKWHPPRAERFLSKDGHVEVLITDQGNAYVTLNKKFGADGVVTECVTAHMDAAGAVVLKNQNGEVLA
jgi:hypothetical protein